MIYLDHNATTPLDPRVLEAMEPFLRERWGNPSSPYGFGRQARQAVEQARACVAEHLGCAPDELVFTGSGTEADNLALRGVVRACGRRPAHLLVSAIEHHAVLRTGRDLNGEGQRVDLVLPEADGRLDPEAVAERIEAGSLLVAVMHANNETGVIQPVLAIAQAAHARGALVHVDAVQTLGKLPVRPADLDADLLAFSGHKIYGPKGIGCLYVKRGTPVAAIITGGEHEGGLRAGTENVPAIVGLARAVELACARQSDEATRTAALRDDLERRVCTALPGVRVNGGAAPRVPNTSNLGFDGVDGESILLSLELAGICASTGSACATGEPEPSHVLTAMGQSARQAQGAVRLSLGCATTQADIDTTVEVLTGTVKRLRAVSSL